MFPANPFFPSELAVEEFRDELVLLDSKEFSKGPHCLGWLTPQETGDSMALSELKLLFH